MKRGIGHGILRIAALGLAVVLLIGIASWRVPVFEIIAGVSDSLLEEKQYAEMDHGWNLMLVNSEYYIPKDYQVPEMTQLSNGEQVDARIYPSLQKMFDDARATGLDLYVASGYRTEERQKELMTEKVRLYRVQGYSKKEAEKLARQWVAEAGTSEHQLGIAVDINANQEVCSSEAVYGWLEEHAHEYGFIKRYPSDKVHITGIAHEPWHYRYVGERAAEEIYRTGACLEEFIEDKYLS